MILHVPAFVGIRYLEQDHRVDLDSFVERHLGAEARKTGSG
jgi:hypothetical protein